MKLRLPHKLQAALIATLASAAFTTLSSGTIAVATGAALLAGQQAQAQVTGIHPMKEVVVAGETYTTTTENGILVAEGDKADGSPISVPDYTAAEYLVLTSTNGAVTNLGRYKVNATANLQNFGTVVLAAGSYQGDGGAVNFNGGQIFVNGGVTLTNDFIIGTSGYVESGYDGAFRLGDNVTFAGSLTLVQDAKMTVDGSSTVQGVVSGEGKTLTLGRSGSLTFNNQTTLGGLAMGSASATFNGAAAAKNSIGTVTSNAGATLTLINTDATIGVTQAQSFNGNLYIGSGSTVTVIQNDSLGYGVTDTITVAEGGTLAFGNKRWTLGANNTIVMAGGTITGTGDGTNGANGTLDYYVNGGVLRATKTSTVAAPIRLRNSNQTTTFDVVKDAELTIDGIINGNGNLAKAGAGVLVLKKNATYGGSTSLQGGTLKIATGATLSEGVFTMANGATFVNDGTATIGKVGSASTLGGTLTNNGTLNLAGNITVNTDVVTSFEEATTGEKTYEGGGTSGYLSSDTTTYYLVHTTSGTVTKNANITGVSNLTFDEGTGNITFTRNATGSGIYYVNDELTYDAATMGEATGFAIAAGATLTSDGSSYSPGKALHGAGTYALASGATTLNGGLTLGTDWAGTVVITNAGNNNTINEESLVNGTLSTLQLEGFSGWFGNNHWYGERNQNIKLVDYVNASGSTISAWKNAAASSQGTYTETFAGTWSGTGTFESAGTNRMDYAYSGDISAWEGKFLKSANGRTDLKFLGNAHTVNAAIEKTGGTLNVIADTDVQFNKAITADTFTVNAGKTATFTTAATAPTISTLTGTGTVVLDATKSASAATTRSGWTGTVTLTGNANGARTFSNFTNGTSSTLELKGYGGWSDTWNGTYTQNIKLTNDETLGYAWYNWANTTTSDTTYATFSGTISGDGTLEVKPDKLNYKFTGDVSGWTGAYKYTDDNCTSTLVFSGSADKINARIWDAGTGSSQLKLQVDTTATFSKDVTVDTLTVNTNKSATLQGGGTLGALTGAGALVVDSGSNSVAVTGAASGYTGAVTVTSGSLAFSDAASAASVSVAEGGSLMLGSGLTTTGNMTVGNGATLGINASAPLTIGGNLELGNNITYNIGGVRHAGEYTVASAGGTLTFGTSGNVVNLNSSIYSGTLSQKDNNLVLNVEQTGKVLHLLLLTGQSNSLGAVKGEPASATMLNEYAPQTIQMWDGNMSGSVSDPSADTKNKAWQDEGKQWFTVQQQSTPTGKDAYGPANTPYANLKGGANLVGNWGGNFVMGPEYGFSYMMEKRGWNINDLNTTSIIKVSRDGGDSGFWNPADSKNICPQIKDTIIKAILAADTEHYDVISLDGLMFLQGESSSAQQGRDVKGVVNSMITWLQEGLAAEMQEGGQLAGVSDKLTVTIGDTIILGEPADFSRGGSKPSAETYKQWALDAPGQAGFVYAHDLGVLSTEAYHYDGNSQITIGARYAYAMAQVQGLDTTQNGTVRVRSQAYGDTGLGESPVSLNDDAAWWKSSGDKTAYSAESLASTVAVWDVSSAHMANGERITGDLALGGIRIEDPYSDGQNPGDHQAIITINSDSTGYALSIGEHGIELQQGDLTIGANVNATASQSWNTVYTPEGGTARTNHLAVTGTVTIEEGVLLTFKEGSHIRFNSIVGTGSLTIGNGVTLAMSQADVDLKGGHYSEDENGFRTDDTVLIELTGENSAITATLDQLHFEDALAGQTIKLSDDRKSMLLDTTTSMTFHVRDSVVEYSADHPEILDAKSISLHDMGGTGATLLLKQNLPGGDEPVTIVATGNGGTVVIAEDVTLAATSVNAADGPVTITGSGVLVGRSSGSVDSLAPADVFGTGVTLSDDWRGTVKIANTTIPDGNIGIRLNDLGNANSVVEFEGVKAFLNADSYTYTPNIKLTGTGLEFDAGTSNAKYTFNGDVMGDGTLKLSLARGSNTETFDFAGDVTNWNGEILANNNKTLTVSFSKESGTVNARITRTGGVLNVVANANTTFNAALTSLTKLTVNEDVSATVAGGMVLNGAGATTLDGAGALNVTSVVSGTGSITKDGTGTVTLSAANTYSGGTTVSAGTLKTTDASALGTGNVTIGADGTLDVSGKLIIGGQTKNQGGFLTNSGALVLEDGALLELFAGTGSRTYNIGNVTVNGSATIMNRWSDASLYVTSIHGDADDTLVLETNHCNKRSLWYIGPESGAAENFQGTLVLQLADTDGGNNRAVDYYFRDGGMFSSAILELQDGPYSSTIDRTMAGNIILNASEVKFGGINDLPKEGENTRTATWTVKSNSNTETRTLVLDAESGSYTTKAGIDARVNIKKTGASEQTFTGSTANFNGSIDVEAGVLNIMNAASVSPADVTIGANGTLGVYKGTEATPSTANEGTLTIQDTQTLKATGAGATLNANLELASGSTLDVSATGGTGLHLGSTLTINPGMKLSDADMRNVWDLKIGQTYNLIYGEQFNELVIQDVEGWTGTYSPGDLTAADKLDAHKFYNDLQENHYYVVFTNEGGNVGTYAIYCNVPEPTTSTLSLLALCALAARRRRK